MKAWIAVLMLTASPGQAGQPAPAATVRTPVIVRLETTLGTIDVEIDTARAPVTAANFLGYVSRGDYTGGRFHRTVRAGNQPNRILIDVVQAGRDPAATRPDLPPIPLERTSVTGLRHLDGALSMARDGPDTATSDFFICVGDQPELDFGGKRNPDGQGFAVFGRVVAGMDVVRRIHAAPADGQSLTPPIAIRTARIR
jgi:peptidyl-prolyl cis-trans isomerase A (cyclophilin A)